jgi:hypothetical protein
VSRPYSTYGGEDECIQGSKPEGERAVARPRRRWEDNIKIDIGKNRTGWYGQDESGSGYGPVEGSCEHGNEPSCSIKCWLLKRDLAPWG